MSEKDGQAGALCVISITGTEEKENKEKGRMQASCLQVNWRLGLGSAHQSVRGRSNMRTRWKTELGRRSSSPPFPSLPSSRPKKKFEDGKRRFEQTFLGKDLNVLVLLSMKETVEHLALLVDAGRHFEERLRGRKHRRVR